MRLSSFFFILLLIFQTSSASYANEQIAALPEAVMLDGHAYKKEQINQSFLDAVFVKDVLNQTDDGLNLTLSPFSEGVGPLEAEKIRNNYPWLYKHIYPDSLPRLLVVNKWVKPIRIALGMPNNLRPLKDKYEAFYIEKKSDEYFTSLMQSELIKDLEGVISDFAPDIEKLINLPVNYVSQDQNDLSAAAEIRIVITDDNVPPVHYRHRREGFLGESGWEVTLYKFRSPLGEGNIKTGFVFASDFKNQVDGYVLVNERNEIEMSICYINKHNEAREIALMLKECLVRSLGLLGPVRPYDQEASLSPSLLTLWRVGDDWAPFKLELPPEKGLSDFDQYLIRTLYNPALKPGMDYIKAQEILLGKN
ncbi:MAG: hypothetical protein ACK4NR_00010 [Micavibrio sp.]